LLDTHFQPKLSTMHVARKIPSSLSRGRVLKRIGAGSCFLPR
jgi:hypothetical protein